MEKETETETETDTYTYTTAVSETIKNFQRETTTHEYETLGVASYLYLFQFISRNELFLSMIRNIQIFE